MKYILIIGDGMADNGVPELGGLTPLEKAHKPALDALAENGRLGSVVTVPPGLPPGSDTAILSIMGCPTRECYSGRAPLEAAAQGIKLAHGAAAFRCNNVSLSDAGAFEDRRILSHSGGGIEGAQSRELMEYLFSHPDFAPLAGRARMGIAPAESYRHLAFREQADIRGIRLAPPHDHLEERVGDNLPAGCADADVLTELMRAAVPVLEGHPINIKRRAEGRLPANAIWFWAEGTAVELPDFRAQFGKTGAVISAVPLCHGIARLCGLDVISVEGATGELDTNYEGKVSAALREIETHDFVTVHIEAPDECTHCHDLPGKLLAIERLSERVIAPLRAGLEKRGEPFRMLVLSDHKTLMQSGAHDGDPVPFLIYDSRGGAGSGRPYTERDGLCGEMMQSGEMLMPALFGQA